jgi:ADP-heptose:LPS heptosyltransferase
MNLYWVYHYLDRYIGIPLCLVLSLFTSKRDHSNEYKNILVIKLSMIGDTILLVPSVKSLRKHFCKSLITVLCSPLNSDIVKDWNFIDRYIVFDFADCFNRPWKLIKFIFDLRKNKFDLVIDFETWPRLTPIISLLSGAKERVGFIVPNQFRHYLYTKVIPHIKKKHEVESFIDVINYLGVTVEDIQFELKYSKEDEQKIDKLLIDNGIIKNDKFVIIHPGCGIHGYYRQWSEEKYAQICDYIIEKHCLKVIITGTREDSKIADKIILLTKIKPINFVGKTELKEFFALVKKSLLVICGNTGTLHIAAASGIPTIAIHGPTDPEKWGPWGKDHIIIRKNLSCSPCSYLGYEYGCNKRKCLDLVSVDDVKYAIDKKLGELLN